MKDYEIYVHAGMDGRLTTPIYIGIEKIEKLGLYEVYGKKWWVIEVGMIKPKPTCEHKWTCSLAEEYAYCISCGINKREHKPQPKPEQIYPLGTTGNYTDQMGNVYKKC